MPLSLEPASPTTTLEWARYYAAMGWSVVPVRRGEKNPAVAWAPYQQRRATDAELRSWFSTGEMGIGIITGAISNIFVVDFDGEEGAATHARLAPQLGLAPASLTGGGGMHLLFRHPGRRVPTRTALAPGMDIRGDGGFIVAPPSLHASGRPYAWDVDAHPDDIPIVDAPSDFVAAICADAPPGPGGVAPVTRAPGPLGLDMGLVTDGRETYMRNTVLAVARGLYDRLGRLPTEAEVYDEGWPQYSARVDLSRPGRGEREFRAKVRYTVARLARGAVPGFSAPAAGSSAPRGEGAPGGGEGGAPAQAAPGAPPAHFPATPFNPLELETLAPRKWVYGHFLIERFLSVLGAPGGTGKTAYAISVAMAVALGRPLLAEPVHRPGNTWIYNLEDPRDEILRRVYAACLHHKVAPAELAGRLFIDSGRDRALVVADRAPDGSVVATPIVEPLVAELIARGVRLLVVDPFVKSHRLEENKNEQIDFAATLWNRVAELANCAILLVHHFRKGGTPGEADAFRGASALVDAARAAVALSVMSEKEADRLGLEPDQRRFHVRADNAKLNLAPPPSEAVWLRLESVALPNGDHVQAVRRWEPPSPWGDLPMKLIVQILDAIAAGRPNGDLWSPRKEAKDGWAGRVLVDMAALTEGQAVEILRQWTDNKLLTVEEFMTAARKPRQGFKVDAAKIQQMRQQVYGSEEAPDE
jgi:hypothetical protein